MSLRDSEALMHSMYTALFRLSFPCLIFARYAFQQPVLYEFGAYPVISYVLSGAQQPIQNDGDR